MNRWWLSSAVQPRARLRQLFFDTPVPVSKARTLKGPKQSEGILIGATKVNFQQNGTEGIVTMTSQWLHTRAKQTQTNQSVGVAVSAEEVGGTARVRLDGSEGLLGEERLGVRVDARAVERALVEAGSAHPDRYLQIRKLYLRHEEIRAPEWKVSRIRG